jgi:hypothetical protein
MGDTPQTTQDGPPYGNPQPPGAWPTFEMEWEGEIRVIPFSWSTFDVWSELWDGIERCRRTPVPAMRGGSMG